MIVTSLSGGLGNQLFQYAAGRALAHKYGTHLKVDTYTLDNCNLRKYSLDSFNIIAQKATLSDMLHLDKIEGVLRFIRMINPKLHVSLSTTFRKNNEIRCIIRYYEHKSGDILSPLLVKRVASQRIFDFDEDFFTLPDEIYLIGSWLSYKYFDHIRALLIEELTINRKLCGKNILTANHINSTQSVSIHVRRTDKTNNPEYYTTDIEYIKRAMSYFYSILKDPIFFVFSDDIMWCKENIKEECVFFIDWNDDMHAFEDLRLMSLCKHNIIAESSFSWWGAYLNQNTKKIVLSPEATRWVNRDNCLCSDILPPEWIVIK
jgi:hypothetical protein